MTIANTLSFLQNSAGALTTGTINANGAPVTVSISGSEKIRVDTNGYLLVNYTSSVGSYHLQVQGNAYISGALTVSSLTAGALTGSITTATSLAGGTAGQLHYQISPGLSGFAGPGTAGQILVSAGTSAPVYTNTSSIHVGTANVAVNDTGGAAGGLRYQSGANASTFLNIGTAGQVLQVNSGATAPQWTTTGSIHVGTANFAASTLASGSATNADAIRTLARTTAAAHYLTFVDSNNASNAYESLYTTSSFNINPATGNVMIGTGTPGAPLSFTDSLTTKIQLNANAANSYTIGKAAAVNSGDSMTKFVAGATAAGEFGFYNTTNLRLLINNNGAVLINRSSQVGTTRFHVSGGTNTTEYVARIAKGSYADTGGHTTLLGFGCEDSGWSKSAIGHTRTSSYDAGYFGIYVSNDTISGTDASTSTHVRAKFSTSGLELANSLGVGTAASGTTGEIRATNEITAYYTSDARLKENVTVISDPIEKLEQIRGVYFDWTDEHVKNRGGEDGYFVRKHDIGVIAQEVEAILPEIVATRDNGYKAVKYEKIVPLLIECIKEQQTQINQILEKLEKLANK